MKIKNIWIAVICATCLVLSSGCDSNWNPANWGADDAKAGEVTTGVNTVDGTTNIGVEDITTDIGAEKGTTDFGAEKGTTPNSYHYLITIKLTEKQVRKLLDQRSDTIGFDVDREEFVNLVLRSVNTK